MASKHEEKPLLPPTISHLLKSLEGWKVVHGEAPRVKLPVPDQICIVVKNVDQAIDYYSEAFGWGPWYVREMDRNEATFRGKTVGYQLKVALVMLGSIEMELIEVMEGETVHTDFIKEKGGGLHHIRFLVDDLDSTLAALAQEGLEPDWRRQHASAVVYMKPDKVGGLVIELIKKS